MVIESRYWREDLKQYARSFSPKKKPPRFSERLIVNFEKDVTLALFIVRRLAEAGKFSTKMGEHRVDIYRCKFEGMPHSLIFKDISELYDLEKSEVVSKNVGFLCNQFIHAAFTFAERGNDRNWTGLYTCSDFEKEKWIYWVPIDQVIEVLNLATKDYRNSFYMQYDPQTEEWVRQAV